MCVLSPSLPVAMAASMRVLGLESLRRVMAVVIPAL